MNNVVISVRGRFLATQVSGGASLAMKRTITDKDLFDFVWLGDPQLSPDGSRIAYVRVTVNDKKEGYEDYASLFSKTGTAKLMKN
jgi:hypothetical protein